jgi:hypothetical protein
MEKSKEWAGKLLSDSGQSDIDLVKSVYRTAYGRSCSPDEQQRALKFITDYGNVLAQVEPQAKSRKEKVWAGFCQAIIESAEFRFIE